MKKEKMKKEIKTLPDRPFHVRENWQNNFRLFYSDEAQGSAAWKVTPMTVRIFIQGLLDKTRGETKEEMVADCHLHQDELAERYKESRQALLEKIKGEVD